MTYFVTFASGAVERNFPITRLHELLDDLENADSEHPDVALTHESGWTLSVGRSGSLNFENVESGESGEVQPVHLKSVARTEILDLLGKLAAGQLDALRSHSWIEGYA